MIFIVLTWVLWFFGYDIRDIRYKIKDEFSDIKARTETQIQPQTNTESKIDTQNQPSPAKQDELINKCMKSFENCKDIATQKYDMSISLLKVEKFEEKSKANEFYKTWEGLLFLESIVPIDDLPTVLFATQVRDSQGALPHIFICNKEGDLINLSKIVFEFDSGKQQLPLC